MKNKIEYLDAVNWDVLNTYIESGLIISNKHPEYDIWILNYTPKTQFGRNWDIYTLSCRGLVIDKTGKIIARPFQKFKNYEEHNPNEIDMSMKYEVLEKVDGSMIIIFYYPEIGSWIVASRGSFLSEQAVVAQEILDYKNNVYDRLVPEYTYVCEVIYKSNRIVVDYGDLKDIILLGMIETKTGKEVSHSKMIYNYGKLFSIVKKHKVSNITNLTDLKKLEEVNREGFVVKFDNGFRVKVKFTEYVRLHSIMTNVSNVTVWEYLMNGYDFDDLLDKVPDEFYNWFKVTTKELQCEYNRIETIALVDFIRIYHRDGLTDRRAFAEAAKMYGNRSLLFAIYNKKPYNNIIWKMIKPIWSKPIYI